MSYDNYEPKKNHDRDVRETRDRAFAGVQRESMAGRPLDQGTDSAAPVPGQDVSTSGPADGRAGSDSPEIEQAIIGSGDALERIYTNLKVLVEKLRMRENTIANLRSENESLGRIYHEEQKRGYEDRDRRQVTIRDLKAENKALCDLNELARITLAKRTSELEAARGEIQALKLASRPGIYECNMKCPCGQFCTEPPDHLLVGLTAPTKHRHVRHHIDGSTVIHEWAK